MLIENVHLIHFSPLYFIGCGENRIESVHQLIINNSTFHSGLRDRNGTALELVHTYAEIINSSFLYNNGSYRGPIGLLKFLILQQKIVPQSLYTLIGGALIVNCSNVSATGSIFEGNNAEIGGAIFSEGSSNIKLTSCSLIHNRAFSSRNLGFGGAIFSESGPYSPMIAFIMRASVTLVNTKFSSNGAFTEGGAIFAFFYSN